MYVKGVNMELVFRFPCMHCLLLRLLQAPLSLTCCNIFCTFLHVESSARHLHIQAFWQQDLIVHPICYRGITVECFHYQPGASIHNASHSSPQRKAGLVIHNSLQRKAGPGIHSSLQREAGPGIHSSLQKKN